MADVVFYPDAHPESTSVDGYAESGIVDAAWATVRVAAGAAAIDSADGLFVQFNSFTSANTWRHIFRAILLFDTSSIPDDAIITSATLSIYGSVKTDTGSYAPTINVYASLPASSTALIGSDYSTLGTTALATAIAYASWSTTGYNDFTLNAAGIAAINLSGITKLGLREATYDAPNNAPTWVSGTGAKMEGWSAEKGTTFRPKLTVTYNPVVTTQAMTEIDGSTATGNGNMINLGGPTATQHGHCWKIRVDETTTPPTTSDSKTENGVPSATGAFTSSLTGLTVTTPYLVRAYATNTTGTGYGEQVTFIAGAPTAGDRAGPIRIVEDRLHYVDAYGVERWLKGTVV